MKVWAITWYEPGYWEKVRSGSPAESCLLHIVSTEEKAKALCDKDSALGYVGYELDSE